VVSGNEQLILSLLQEVRTKQEEISAQASNFESTLMKHAADSKAMHQQLMQAFPAGDTDGHRRYHESVIEWRELRNKIVRECLIHAAKLGGLFGFGWILYAIWTALKLELTKG